MSKSSGEDTVQARWLAAGEVLRRKSPRLHRQMLSVLEHTVAALPSEVGMDSGDTNDACNRS